MNCDGRVFAPTKIPSRAHFAVTADGFGQIGTSTFRRANADGLNRKAANKHHCDENGLVSRRCPNRERELRNMPANALFWWHIRQVWMPESSASWPRRPGQRGVVSDAERPSTSRIMPPWPFTPFFKS